MKNLRLHAVMLCLLAALLTTALVLSACPAGAPQPSGTSSSSTTAGTPGGSTTGSNTQSGKLTYTVTVVDGNGDPIAGVEVQICDGDRCLMPDITGEDGKVSFKTTSGNFKAQIKDAPAGYVYEQEYPFGEGETSLTVTLYPA